MYKMKCARIQLLLLGPGEAAVACYSPLNVLYLILCESCVVLWYLYCVSRQTFFSGLFLVFKIKFLFLGNWGRKRRMGKLSGETPLFPYFVGIYLFS